MDRITLAVPRPRPVRLAGRDFLVWEARLADLADLQAWVDRRSDDPADGFDAALAAAGDDPDARDRVVFRAYAALEGGGAAYDTAAGRAALATPEGVAFFLDLCLRRGHPGLTPDDLAGLVGEGGATHAEFAAAARAFFGADPRSAVVAALGLARPGGGPAAVTTWGELIDRVARSHGWTYEYIHSLTMTEFLNALRRGKPEERGITGPPSVLESLQKRMRKALGLDRNVPDGDI